MFLGISFTMVITIYLQVFLISAVTSCVCVLNNLHHLEVILEGDSVMMVGDLILKEPICPKWGISSIKQGVV